jgi:hypothetical protein
MVVKAQLSGVALAISLAEILIIGGVLVSLQMSNQPPTPYIVKLTDTTWLIGAPGSFGFAVAGLFVDSDRRTAVLSLIVAILASLICAIPLMISA